MHPGVYRYHGIEHRGTNDYGRPISVVTLEKHEVVKMYYAPSSLYWDLKNRSETNFIKYEGTQTSVKGYEYPIFQNSCDFALKITKIQKKFFLAN